MRTTQRSPVLLITGLLMLLIGIALGIGGVQLILLGGSWYYALAALGFVLTGLLLFRRTPLALWIYTVLLVASLAWSLWEAGLDWWPLAARLGVPFVLGAWLLTPWVRRGLYSAERPGAVALDGGTLDDGPLDRQRIDRDRMDRGQRDDRRLDADLPQRRARGGLPLMVAMALVLVVSVASWFSHPHRIDGTVPAATGPALADASGVPAGEWHAYGRTGYGQRYSPLDQITPDNVGKLEVAWTYRTGDVRGQPGDPEETTFEVTPLKIGNRLFLCTPHQSVIALDATTGQQVWRLDPKIRGELALQHLTCRGLSYHADGVAGAGSTGTAADTDAAGAADAANAANAANAVAGTTAPASGSGTAAAGSPASPGATGTGGATAGIAATPPTSPGGPTGAIPPMPATSPATTADLTPSGAPIAAIDLPTTDSCPARLFMPTADGRLIAINPDDGKVCGDFGGGDGQIDLWANMPFVNPGSYYSTSPVVVTASLVIVGGTVLDNVSTTEPSGVIRAFDVHTGELVWNWDSGNPTHTAPIAAGEHYTPSSPNSWSISSVDEELGLVYVPTGNQPPDQWGGNRSAEVERYSSAVVALELATGRERWVFQTVHHDLWDYDVPAQPSLIDLTIEGRRVPALVQPTKQGELFVLDRRTGEPLLPVTETPAPQGASEGDHTAPTQPVSALSYDPPPLSGRDMWGATLFDQLSCRIALHKLRYEGRFTPPSTQGTLVYPGNFGVFNWGSVAVDPQRQITFTTPTRLAFVSRLIPREDRTTLYVNTGDVPQHSVALPSLNENFGAPFAVSLAPFVSKLGLPCQAPPWGYVAVSDLTTGKRIWEHKNGTVRDSSPLPLPFRMGVPNLGGPVMTAGGVAFLSGTLDYYARAYDVSTGKQLWQSRLPAGGQATPMTYLGEDGRQYVLVAAGGHGSLGTKTGDYVIAYALPAQ